MSLLTRRLTNRGRAVLFFATICLAVGLAVIDLLTGDDVSFLIFYIAPIFVASWWVGREAGMLLALITTLAWMEENVLQDELPRLADAWVSLEKLVFFGLVAYGVARIRELVDHERALARSDPLTGAANLRAFAEVVAVELDRSSRYGHPLTVAYLDLDDFKKVNDRLGHNVGDRLLRETVRRVIGSVRTCDTVARLGGDEFAVLLPETGPEAGRAAMEKIRACLQALARAEGWPISFSIGLATFLNPPRDVEALLHPADSLMYEAKRSGKDRVVHRVLPDARPPEGLQEPAPT